VKPIFRSFVVLLLAALWLAVPTHAVPPKPKPPDASVSQYVETVPSSGGATAPGIGKAKTKPLPKQVAKKVETQGGADAGALTKIATSSDLGAPTNTIPAAQTTTRPAKHTSATGVAPTPATAVPVVASDSGSNRLVWLAVALVVAAAAAAGAVGLRRRTSRS
jgi:hypothetical protein